MNAYEVNRPNALIAVPNDASGLQRYLEAITRALGLKSDADLARLLKVPKTTLSSWKRRGSIPEDVRKNLEANLLPWIASMRHDMPNVNLTSRAAVIRLLANTSGNPIKVERFDLTLNAGALGGLLALAELLGELEGLNPRRLLSSEVERLSTNLEACMPAFRDGLLHVEDLSQ